VPDISYTPDFEHTSWLDNVDRVQADGPNGFNVRFKTIESDLKELSTVIARINDALVETPPPTPQRLSLTPAIVSTDPVAPPSWMQEENGTALAQHTAGENSHGLMNLTLPDKVRLLSLRVAGRNVGVGNATIVTLRRSPIFENVPTFNLAQVRGDTDPYDHLDEVDAGNARVDTSRFRYAITAVAQSITDDTIMTISAIEIMYIAD
jgi:hypothetical protein